MREERNWTDLLLNRPLRALKSGKVYEATSKPELYRRTSLGLVLCSKSVYTVYIMIGAMGIKLGHRV